MGYKRIKLDYDYSALEPFIDEKTMDYHYNKHHKGYEEKLNNFIKDTGIEKKFPTLLELMKNYQELEDQFIKVKVRELGGGLINHNFFFTNLKVGTELKDGKLKTEIEKTWGSVEEFKRIFKEISMSVFGSGWVWLVKRDNGELKVIKTFNQDTPWYIKFEPILGLDLWEHAYYLKYNADRSTYIDNFWNVVDWDKAEKNYSN